MSSNSGVFESNGALARLLALSPENMVGSLAQTSEDDEIREVAQHLRGTPRWLPFVRYAIDFETVWTAPKPLAGLRELLDPETVKALIPDQLEAMERTLGQIGVDDHWATKIRRFIVKGDLERAWDELKKANRGFMKDSGGFEQTFLVASPERLCQLMAELAEAVGALNLAAAVDHELPPKKSGTQDMTDRFLAHRAFSRAQCTAAILLYESVRRHFLRLRSARRNGQTDSKLAKYKARL